MESLALANQAIEATQQLIHSEPGADDRTVIVSSGRFYSDGDAVEVFIRLSKDGSRAVVSDGGMSMARRSLYGIGSFSNPAKDLWSDVIDDYGVEFVSDRVFVRGSVDLLPHLLGTVADCALALDSVRLLADKGRSSFAEKLERWLSKEAHLHVSEEKLVTDRHGEEQRITAIVNSPRGDVIVQGAGGRTPAAVKRASEHAYFLFSGLDDNAWGHDSRLIVLEKLRIETQQQMRAAKYLVSRLKEQAYVGTFEAQISLQRFFNEQPSGDRDLATLTYGQTSVE